LGYEGRRRNDTRTSEPALLQIAAEEHDLDDNRIILLENPDIELASVRVFDASGTVLYRENLDYILIERDGYIEIQRLPGGQIADGQSIYVDYTSTRVLSFEFSSNSNMFRARLNLFNRLLEPYFRIYTRNYDHIHKADKKILKTVLQRVYGLRMVWLFMNAGMEFDSYQSNVIPYESYRYFIGLNKTFFGNLNTVLRANWREFKRISEHENQKFAEFSGRIFYHLGMYSRVSLDGGYRFQEGRGIDLHLGNLRTEFSTRFRELYFSLGVEMYRRNFAGEKIDYNGGYVKVERKF